jgi:hypothetical protein
VAYFDLPGLAVESPAMLTAARARQEGIRSKRLIFFNSGSEDQEVTGSQSWIGKDFGIGGASGWTGWHICSLHVRVKAAELRSIRRAGGAQRETRRCFSNRPR